MVTRMLTGSALRACKRMAYLRPSLVPLPFTRLLAEGLVVSVIQ